MLVFVEEGKLENPAENRKRRREFATEWLRKKCKISTSSTSSALSVFLIGWLNTLESSPDFLQYPLLYSVPQLHQLI